MEALGAIDPHCVRIITRSLRFSAQRHPVPVPIVGQHRESSRDMPGVSYQLRASLKRMNREHPRIVRADFKLHLLFENSGERLIPEIESDILMLWIKVQFCGEIQHPD